MKRIEWSPLALRDLFGVWDFIAEDSTSNARRYTERLRLKAEKLAMMPGIGRRRNEFGEKNVRSVAEASHVIFYAASDDHRIEIMRVIHGSRDTRTLRLR